MYYGCFIAGPSGRAVKGMVYGLSPTVIVASNPTGGMDAVCCQVEVSATS
jgi:hypothetical protein